MKKPVTVTITGAAGNIGYALAFRVASGQMLGADQPINLNLLEIPAASAAVQGVVMELNDCAFPTLNKVTATSDAAAAFRDCNFAMLVGARPRGPGMERKDLLLENAKIFSAQGKALDTHASRDVRVLVVGNPANTNSLIAQRNAPSLPRNRFTALTRLAHNPALAPPSGDWVSMAVPSDGSYGIPEGVSYSYPVTCKGGEYGIVQGLDINEFSRGKMQATHRELLEEREGVKDLI